MTFEVTHGLTVVRVTLHGDVTPEREANERELALRRAQQLAPATPKRIHVRPRDYYEGYWS